MGRKKKELSAYEKFRAGIQRGYEKTSQFTEKAVENTKMVASDINQGFQTVSDDVSSGVQALKEDLAPVKRTLNQSHRNIATAFKTPVGGSAPIQDLRRLNSGPQLLGYTTINGVVYAVLENGRHIKSRKYN